jgi:hypothetical protein
MIRGYSPDVAPDIPPDIRQTFRMTLSEFYTTLRGQSPPSTPPDGRSVMTAHHQPITSMTNPSISTI